MDCQVVGEFADTQVGTTARFRLRAVRAPYRSLAWQDSQLRPKFFLATGSRWTLPRVPACSMCSAADLRRSDNRVCADRWSQFRDDELKHVGLVASLRGVALPNTWAGALCVPVSIGVRLR